MLLLNLGCGNRFLSNWVNVDFIKSGENVIAHNLLSGVPFPNVYFDGVYHSHVLEHFPKDKAQYFISECYRVLKHDGILRVVVPDLEQVAKLYISQLKNVSIEESDLNVANYEWAVIEMCDQMVRTRSGGEMAKYWRQPEIINEDWLKVRMGKEFSAFRESVLMKGQSRSLKSGAKWKRYFRWSTYRDKLLIKISGEPRLFEYVKIGRFRLGGEIHQWMYDRFSLDKLLRSTGFRSTRVVTAYESGIPNWQDHQWLDVDEDKVRKPDSLFMEAIK